MFTEKCLAYVASSAEAAAQTAVNGAEIDLDGLSVDSLVAVCLTGDVTSGCVLTLKWQQTATTGTGYADVDGASTTYTAAAAADADAKILMAELLRPTERYVRCVLTRTDQDAVIDGIIVLAGCTGSLPVSTTGDQVGTPGQALGE